MIVTNGLGVQNVNCPLNKMSDFILQVTRAAPHTGALKSGIQFATPAAGGRKYE